tara:strand:+ start:285 stop:1703 length:1419 start_codon:yes stop_codon:yes gene_type:complete
MVSKATKPQGAVLIKYDNAINYPVEDQYYLVTDTTKHLKLRIDKTAIPESKEGRVWVYDFHWRGKRYKKTIGKLDKDSKGQGSLTPPQARDRVNKMENVRKDPVAPQNPLYFNPDEDNVLNLNNYFEDFLKERKIKKNSEYEINQKKSRYKRHIEDSFIGINPITELTYKKINDWFNSLVSKHGDAEAIKCLGLAKHMTKYLIKNNELTLPNKFTFVEIDDLREEIAQRNEEKKRPLTSEEFKAIWNACEQHHNPVEGLYIQFVMALGTRGKPIAELKEKDVKKIDGKYQFDVLHKGKPFPVVLNPLAKEVYEKAVKEAKQYPISPYLFPSYIYSRINSIGGTGRLRNKNQRNKGGSRYNKKVTGVRETPMNQVNRRRIWKGRVDRETKGKLAVYSRSGILGIAMQTCPSVRDVNVHDFRDTWATISDEGIATDLLQNYNKRTISKHYRKKLPEHYEGLADYREVKLKEILE